MFDILEMMEFGQEFKAHGKNWIKVKGLQNGWCLAVEKESKSPADVKMVYNKDLDHKQSDNR